MTLAGWGGIPDLGSCPQGFVVAQQLICGYYHWPKDLGSLKRHSPLFLQFPLLPSETAAAASTSSPLCVCTSVCVCVYNVGNHGGWCHRATDGGCFSPCLQEADSVPGPDLCPAAARSRRPVLPAERKSNQPTSTRVRALTPLLPYWLHWQTPLNWGSLTTVSHQNQI